MAFNEILKEKLTLWAYSNGYFTATEDGVLVAMPKIANHLSQILPLYTSINLREVYLYLCSVLAESEYIQMTEFDFTATVFDSLDNGIQEYLTSPICFDLVLSHLQAEATGGLPAELEDDFPIETIGTYIFLYEKGEEPTQFGTLYNN
jgi:hypothetical protein